MQFYKSTFGYTSDKELVSLYRLENSSGAYLEVTDYGCRLRSICVPDKNGVLNDVCLGYPEVADYEADTGSLGAAVGRHANRIGKAVFSLNGKTYPLEKNDGNNHLHGGSKGFAFRIWETDYKDGRLIFTRRFPDGEDGYPGNLEMKITYEWTEDNRLLITYEAVSDQDTVLNVTNHAYFNLEGYESSSILGHELQIFSSAITENDSESLPTGKIIPVEGTPFDFRELKPIGQDIEKEDIQLTYGSGYDHNFILDGEGFRRVCVLQSKKSGIRMTCSTDQPGIQLYTANYLGGCKGKYGEEFKPRGSVCLETQRFPNATNHPEFPTVVIKAKEPFKTVTWYEFDIIS